MKAVANRFHAKVGPRTATGCMEWQGTKMPRGYGVAYLDRNTRMLAHRLAFQLVHGEAPPGMVVMHTCDNPSCVNHEHLRAGFQRDNIADMVAKRRHGWRDGTPWQKIFAADAQVIHTLRAEGCTQQQIADRLGVSRSLISMHLNGKLLTSKELHA